MQTQSDSGIVSRLGARSVDETVTKLQTLLEQRKIRLFAESITAVKPRRLACTWRRRNC